MMSNLTSEHYHFLLLHTSLMSAQALRSLKKRYSSYEQASQQSRHAYIRGGLTPKQADSIIERRSSKKAIQQILNRIDAENITFLLSEDEGYPTQLAGLKDRPEVLYIRGMLDERPRLSIVGSRKCDKYGENIAYDVAAIMAKLGVSIVSGLAYGIDSFAHQGALRADGHTVAVLGCGIERVYPADHRGLAQNIVEGGGAIISEFPFFTESFPGNFPIRNRIIAALSTKSVLLIQGDIKSGAMITMSLAKKYDKDCWVLPGNILSHYSTGPHALLRDGATPLLSINDLVDDYGFRLEQPVVPVPMEREEKIILDAVPSNGVHIDELAERLQLDISELSSKVILLELKGAVRHEGAGVYRRII